MKYTSEDLIGLIRTPAFIHELTEMSSYLVSLMQERPIVHLVAKHLWKAGIPYSLEDKHQDLSVDGTHIEFKYNFDTTAMALAKDLERWPDLRTMWKQIKSKSWSTMAKIYQDVCGNERKKPPGHLRVDHLFTRSVRVFG